MATRLFHFFINTFLVITLRSNRLMRSIAEDHFAKLTGLQADPDVAAILATFGPILDSYITTDNNYKFAKGTYKGKTQTVEELFEKLNHEKLNAWRGVIHNVYNEGTPEEAAFFPQHRKAFQTGTYEDRIAAIKVLADRCALDTNASIIALGVQVLAFHTQIKSARTLQQSQGEAAVANLSKLREDARVLLADELFGNMCLLLHKHRHKPSDVSQYFEMKYLVRHAKEQAEIEVEANDVETILENIDPAQIITGEVENTSRENVTVQLYYAAGISDLPQPGDKVFELSPRVKKSFAEMDLGAPKAFLNIFNKSTEHLGTVEVTGDLAEGTRGVAN